MTNKWFKLSQIRKYFLLSILFFCSLTSWAQAPITDIDSLLKVLQVTKIDSSRITLLNIVSQSVWLQGDYEKARIYADEALALAEKNLKTADKINRFFFMAGKADAINHIAIIYRFKGDYTESLTNHFAALKIREEIKDKKGIARSYLGIGSIYNFMGNNTEALSYKFKSKKLYEELKDTNGLANVCTHIGLIYYEQGKYKDAKGFFIQSVLHCMNSKGWNFSVMASAYSYSGLIYELEGNYKQAIENYNLCLTFKMMGHSKEGIAEVKLFLGRAHVKIHKYKEAAAYLNDAMAIAKKIGNKEHQKNIYKGFTQLDSATGNFAKAFEHHKLYMAYRDSLVNQKTAEKISQMQAQVENEKKEQIRALKESQETLKRNEEKKQQRIILYAVSGGLILMFGLAFVMFRSYRQKQRSNTELLSKNDIISKQKHEVEEKHKEITDSINYAERIQRSFLATKELLDENLNTTSVTSRASVTDNYFVLFQPKDVVSGDFYWSASTSLSHQHSNQKLFYLATADSTGHGVPGAIMSILNISSLEKAIESGVSSPAEILNHTRKTIIERLKKDGSAEGGKDGMDCSLICLNSEKTKLVYAAANNPVWIVRNNNLIELAADKIPVGKHDRDSVSFTQHETELQKGDMIYTLTDGFPDQFGGEKGKKFMYKKLKETLISISDKNPQEQKEILEKILKDWMGNTEQVDDITIIGIRV